MNKIKKSLIFLMLIAVVALSGCSGDLLTSTSWPGLMVDNETAYVSNANRVMAVRLSDGGLIWSFPEEPSNQIAFFATPEIANGELIVGDYQNVLYGINPDNGNQIWTFEGANDRYVASVLVYEDKIFAPSTDRVLYALDSNQNVLWEFETERALWAKPVTDGELIYQPSMDHFLYAIDIDSGQQVWKTDLGGAVGYSPTLNDNGTLFIGSLANEMIALQKSNGNPEWRLTTERGVWTKPLLVDGVLYFGDLSGTFYAVDAETGTISWQISNEGSVVGAAAVIPDGLAFVTEEGEVVAVDFTGKILWRKSFEGSIYSTPRVAEDQIIIALTQGESLLVSLDFNGNQRWSFTPPK